MIELNPNQDYEENFHIPIFIENKTKRKLKVQIKIKRKGLIIEVKE